TETTDVSGVVITDTIPAFTTYIANSDTPEADADINPLVWSDQTITTGGTTYAFEVKVSPQAEEQLINNTVCLKQPDIEVAMCVDAISLTVSAYPYHIYLPLVVRNF
ncbi:MAG: hypothetical protein ACK2UQ_04010, partial [Anaerolineae bacterium]